ncbi:MAG: flagellar biosynthesis protein FlhB [Chitinivibrionia bacterium]|nr:flagellar biosynthesis protein FlhB [Chitinivibrionia bacterium]
MPEQDDQDSKTEAPTEKRRQEAREEGNVCKSPEVSTIFVLLAGVVFLRFAFPYIYRDILMAVDLAFANLSPDIFRDITFAKYQQIFTTMLRIALGIILPLALFIAFWGIIGNLVQVGFLFTLKPLKPKLSKINPISGLKNLISPKKIFDTAKNVLKLIIIGTVSYIIIRGRLEEIMGALHETTGSIVVYMLLLLFDVAITIIITLIVIAVVDYGYQRYEHYKKLKMTKQQIKDEHKQSDGDPQIKSRIRQLQREASRRRMMENVPKATVVVTNPTHLSIAIQYEQETMDAPLIVAKGADQIALKIRELAKEHNVPLYEDVPLARAMYDKVEVGDMVPQEFFAAVAEIIAYVYKLQGKTM